MCCCFANLAVAPTLYPPQMTLRGPPGGDDRGPCGDGINYAAVLDTAIDVARAMVHLHKQSVSGRDITTPCFCIGGAECMHRVLPEVCKVLGARTHEY